MDDRIPAGYRWPRFADGEPVLPGGMFMYGGRAERVQRIIFCRDVYVIGFTGRGHEIETCGIPYGTPLGEPFAEGSRDGEPIRIGDVVYGEDGCAWEVIGLRLGSRYQILGRDGEKVRAMKADWLTHEQPDTWDAWYADLADYMYELTNGEPVDYTDMLDSFCERAAKLGGVD